MLVTIAIFAVGILALTKMQLLSVRGTGFNREATAATVLAQKAIEDFKSSPFGTTPAVCGMTQNGMTVACAMSVSGVSPYRYCEIMVTISWGIPAKQISVSTGIAEP